MVVLRWHDNAFTGMAEFEPDERGYIAFERLVRSEIDKPIKLLIDIIEEDIRVETAPYLLGSDRRAVHQRLLNRYFRQYSHSYLQVQGRQADGRRDNIVLLMALTNSKLFQPWLKILERAKAPLEGLYSVPLVGESLIKTLGATKENVLLISQQVPSSIRQSFYSEGKLKLSRLVPAGDEIMGQQDVLQEEIERTVRYLENQHYIDTAHKLHIYIIATTNEQAELQEQLQPDARKQYHIIDKNGLASDLGLKNSTPGPYCYWLYAQQLCAGKYSTLHYATRQDRRYYFHYVARKSLWSSAAAAILVATVSALWFLFSVHSVNLQLQGTAQDTAEYNRLYQEIIADISDLSLEVEDVRDAVDVTEQIKTRNDATPLIAMQKVSGVLATYPRIELKSIKWIATSESGHSYGETKQDLDAQLLRHIQRGTKALYYDKALIEASVTGFQGNPRFAIEEVQRFVAELQTRNQDTQVEIVKMPFDIDSSSRMVGRGISQNESGNSNTADFAFVLVDKRVY